MKQKIECLLDWLDDRKARVREQKTKRDDKQSEDILDRILQNEVTEDKDAR